uniref:RNA-directed DNA polymerase n=1 Tax=Meloidogyne hapla TaxID=6305 RepID=A0A1I8BJB9_MELHA
MGTINYYGKFVKEMHKLRGPLDKLLQKNIEWNWGQEQELAFEEIKRILNSNLLLTHFDPDLEIIVTADASNYGVGAMIAHKFPDGSEKAIEYASKSLKSAEKNYSQIEKEGLALVFAVEKFHKLLYGRKFKLRTDHKPLLAIFGNKKGIKVYTASRLQRWALILTNYDFEIEFIKTHEMGMADTLSRLINKQEQFEDKIIALTSKDKFNTDCIDELNQSEESVKYILNTENDIELKLLKKYIAEHWPKEIKDKEMKYWSNIRQNLQVIDDCIVFTDKVVIPKLLRKEILQSLHEFHPGIAKMKGIAREYLYWPNIGKDIEECKNCVLGLQHQRIGNIDFAGPCKDGKLYLIVIDAHSKWPEVFGNMTNSAKDTIKSLDWLFTHYGYPEKLVSDNGSPFRSIEFKNYCIEKGIEQLFSPPYHPQSNGQAEHWLQEVLLNYRASPHASLGGKTPAEEFLNRKLRLKWDALRPKNIELNKRNVLSNANNEIVKNKMKNWFDKHHGAKLHDYKIGDHVWFTNYNKGKIEWLEVTRHSNQLRKRPHIVHNSNIGKNKRIERPNIKNCKIYELRNRTINCKLNYINRSEVMPYKDGSIPNTRAKILAEGSDDQMISNSEGTSNENQMDRWMCKNKCDNNFSPSFL